jgi:hypothetical protein
MSFAMTLRTPLPLDLVSEVASHAPNNTLLQLFYLSHASKRIARLLLYRNIAITKDGPLLVRTLASDTTLPPLVRSILPMSQFKSNKV